jgi:hypothetical protein
MLEAVKDALGISADVYDDEFTRLINSAKADLQLAGIVVIEDTDPLIITAVSSYCQANRGTDTDKRLAYREMYLAQKRNLMRAHEYTEAVTP